MVSIVITRETTWQPQMEMGMEIEHGESQARVEDVVRVPSFW